MREKYMIISKEQYNKLPNDIKNYFEPFRNRHPTVKRLALFEYLIKLCTTKDSIVLDPFLGSGTTAIACVKTGRQWIGIEKSEEYVRIAEARIKFYSEQTKITEELK